MTLWYLRKDGEPRRKLIERETAEEAVIACGDEEAVILAGKEVWIALFALEREPGDFETVDEETGLFVLDVAGLEAKLHREIDEGAGAQRCRFLTNIPGQALTYMRKESEARAFVAGATGPFPMLEAVASATGGAIGELAATIVARADAWIEIGAVIEAARQKAKMEVSAAQGTDAKRAAADVDWEKLIAPYAQDMN